MYNLIQYSVDSEFVIDIPIYILHLTGNEKRFLNIQNQLQKISSVNTHILLNPGYKKYKKENVNSSKLDLIHAFKYILSHANYFYPNQNILLFEDDYELNMSVEEFETYYLNIIEPFISTVDFNIYLLGCLPFITFGINYHYFALLTAGMHSVILSPKYIQHILDTDIKTISDWDTYSLKFNQRYCFYKPIFCQLFEQTENQKNWDSFYGLTKIFLYFISFLGLNKNFNSYKYFYILSIFIFCVLFIN